jgi:hypothetical protein
MDTHHVSHSNGHVRRSTRQRRKRTAKRGSIVTRASGTLKALEHKVGSGFSRLVADRRLTGLGRWIAHNPVTACGIAMGAGLIVGAIGNGRFGRTAFRLLGEVIARRFA